MQYRLTTTNYTASELQWDTTLFAGDLLQLIQSWCTSLHLGLLRRQAATLTSHTASHQGTSNGRCCCSCSRKGWGFCLTCDPGQNSSSLPWSYEYLSSRCIKKIENTWNCILWDLSVCRDTLHVIHDKNKSMSIRWYQTKHMKMIQNTRKYCKYYVITLMWGVMWFQLSTWFHDGIWCIEFHALSRLDHRGDGLRLQVEAGGHESDCHVERSGLAKRRAKSKAAGKTKNVQKRSKKAKRRRVMIHCTRSTRKSSIFNILHSCKVMHSTFVVYSIRSPLPWYGMTVW